MKVTNYQVVVGHTNKDRLLEAGVCICFAGNNRFKIIGKYRQLHKAIKDLNLICYGEVEKIPTVDLKDRF